MKDYLHEVFLESVSKVIIEMQESGSTTDEIKDKLERNGRKALESVVEKASDVAVGYMKDHMYEICLEWEANDAVFLARQDQKWGKCFAASRILYSAALDAASDYSHYMQEKRNETDLSSIQYTFPVLRNLHGRACQEFLEILELMRGGFADGAYARCRSMYELCCVGSFIKENGEHIAKAFYDQANSDMNTRPYKWANEVKDDKGVPVNSFGQIQRMCNMAQPWREGYDLSCLLTHASPQGTFGRLANGKGANVISVGRSDYGIKTPAEHSALCLQWITGLFLTVFPHTDSTANAIAISKWSQYVRDIYYSTHDIVFAEAIKAVKAL